MDKEQLKNRHNNNAPWWAAAMILFGITGISTIWIDLGSFWKGYVLDMTGPAWNYILFRRLSHAWSDNIWTRFFTPLRTFLIFTLVCFGIETLQYYKVYESTFDPWDFPAYVSILVLLFILDSIQNQS